MRIAMWALLIVVAASAAVLSFSSLRDLAVLCGYSPRLAPLFPVTVDAGAGAACLAWLGGQSAATGVGRTLTWTLLVASVGMNAVVHYLGGYGLRPAWWPIVGVSAVPPATLGAVVHLAVLVGRPAAGVQGAGPDDLEVGGADEIVTPDPATDLPEGLGRRRLAAELGVTEYAARQLLAERNGAAS
jgi:hypothetical protein